MRRDRSPRNSEGSDDAYDEFRIRPGEAPSFRVVRAVAATTGRDCEELRPLYDVVDPDALDELISGSAADLRVEFRYEGCHVRVDTERVVMREAESVNSSRETPDIE